MVTRATRVLLLTLATLAGAVPAAIAQTAVPDTRQATLERQQHDKSTTLHPYELTAGERLFARFEAFLNRAPSWHPFLETAYHGGGLPIGAGYKRYVSPYSFIDARASYTVRGYKRAEAELVVPRLFHRRGELSVLGGWREATQVDFFGFGTDTPKSSRATYGFEQPYGSALLSVRPGRGLLLRGGFEVSQWSANSGDAGGTTVADLYTPVTLPGIASTTTYLQTQGTVGLDWRSSPGYARRGGFYGVTVHDFSDPDSRFGFEQVDYEVVQHLPILRDAWVISLHGLAETTYARDNQAVPFFMLPSLGGGSNLRGYSSWRFRDRNSLLLQAEWRIVVNRFLDTAVFYDAGQVVGHPGDFDLNHLKSDVGFGARFHSPFSTPLRIDLARGSEGLRIVFATSSAF